MIQLRMKPQGERLAGEFAEPDIAVYAQHNFCEIRPWPQVRRLALEEKAERRPATAGAEHRPLVFVGRGSHGSFFEPGFHSTDFYDITDGKRRPKSDPRLELIGDPHPAGSGGRGAGAGRAQEAGAPRLRAPSRSGMTPRSC